MPNGSPNTSTPSYSSGTSGPRSGGNYSVSISSNGCYTGSSTMQPGSYSGAFNSGSNAYSGGSK